MTFNIYYEDESGTQIYSETVTGRQQASGRFQAAANRGCYLGDSTFIPFHRIWRAETVDE